MSATHEYVQQAEEQATMAKGALVHGREYLAEAPERATYAAEAAAHAALAQSYATLALVARGGTGA